MQFSCDGFLSTTKFVIAAKAAFHFRDTYIDQSHTSRDNAVAKERKKERPRGFSWKTTVGSGSYIVSNVLVGAKQRREWEFVLATISPKLSACSFTFAAYQYYSV